MSLNKAQNDAVGHIYEYGETYLIGPMGSGKTLTALTAIDELMRDAHIARVLVVAPKRVCTDVWPGEIEKWGFDRLNAAVAAGPPDRRVKVFMSDANVVCISFELIDWLFKQTDLWNSFDMLVIDELTKLKAGGIGFKAMRAKLDHFEVRLGMTGTPVSESFTGLFYQVFAVDAGKAFGKNKTKWLEKYFYPTDYKEYNWEVRPDKVAHLIRAFKHLIVRLPAYTDELPALTETVVDVDECRSDEYEQLAGGMVVGNIVAANAAVLVGKLQQAANGFLYREKAIPLHLHEHKLDALRDLLHKHAQEPMVLVYQFEEEKARLDKLLGTYDVDQIAGWRNDPTGRLALHPRSAGHGVDLTHSSVMVFMSPVWSRDQTVQTIARIWRRGQTRACTVYTLCGRDTVDLDIMSRVDDKAGHHEILLATLK